MLKLMTYMACMYLLLKLMQVSGPHSLLLSIAIALVTVAIMVYLKIMNPWFSYIFAMMLISGLLMIIIYMTSMLPNNMFYNPTFPQWTLLPILFMTLYLLKWDTLLSKNFLFNFYEFNELYNFTISYIYTEYLIFITLFFVTLLVMVLFISMKINKNDNMPLRYL